MFRFLSNVNFIAQPLFQVQINLFDLLKWSIQCLCTVCVWLCSWTRSCLGNKWTLHKPPGMPRNDLTSSKLFIAPYCLATWAPSKRCLNETQSSRMGGVLSSTMMCGTRSNRDSKGVAIKTRIPDMCMCLCLCLCTKLLSDLFKCLYVMSKCSDLVLLMMSFTIHICIYISGYMILMI